MRKITELMIFFEWLAFKKIMTNKYIHLNKLSKGLLAGLVASLSIVTSFGAANAAT
ncbi:hypothetical protein IQ244_26640 [Nostoc sp. LEGE 06077]|nr:hypothetical protein [Nostoc sp. LEGE 06077]